MNNKYESSRNKEIKLNGTQAILQGLSPDGGLFVLRNLKNLKINLDEMVLKNYYEIAETILKIFVSNLSDDEIKKCVKNAYENKFSKDLITPLVCVENNFILELFHGPTSAFKDVGLSLLPQLISTSLKKENIQEDILILTATSGDTGKAALEGFKDVEKTKIIVFYPKNGVSITQELQMRTQVGNNVLVCGIDGNFDDAQTGVKQIFLNSKFNEFLKEKNILLSSANSINIGRLIPQIVYYFQAYNQMIKNNEIKLNEKINFVVPTGNFGNILAGYYAKLLGLPINKLIMAANDNNVLYDFFKTGTYSSKRPFLKTISPSMDILISSNLERLLYYVSGCDNEYVAKLMNDLEKKGGFSVSKDILNKIQDIFDFGFATNDETKKVIKDVYEKTNYLLDPHTAVGYKVLNELKSDFKNVLLSTASPYKFSEAVYEALHNESKNELDLINLMHEETKVEIPNNLKDLDQLEIRFSDVIKTSTMENYVESSLNKI